MRSWNTIGAADHRNLLRGREVNIVLSLEKISQEAPVYHIVYIIVYLSFSLSLSIYMYLTFHSQMKCIINSFLPLSPGGRNTGRASDPRRWIWWERKKIEARSSSFPPSDPSAIPTSTVTAPPWWKRGRHREKRWWKHNSQREFSGNEVYAVEATTNAGSRPPREPTLHASLPIRPRTTVCIPLVWCSVGTHSL